MKTCSSCFKQFEHIGRKKKCGSCHKEADATRMLTRTAIASGKLKRRACEVCGDIRSDGHHWSYKPEHYLEIVWLCKRHHRLEHARLDKLAFKTIKDMENKEMYRIMNERQTQ